MKNLNNNEINVVFGGKDILVCDLSETTERIEVVEQGRYCKYVNVNEEDLSKNYAYTCRKTDKGEMFYVPSDQGAKQVQCIRLVVK